MIGESNVRNPGPGGVCSVSFDAEYSFGRTFSSVGLMVSLEYSKDEKAIASQFCDYSIRAKIEFDLVSYSDR